MSAAVALVDALVAAEEVALLPVHAVADVFPEMDEVGLRGLADDIRRHGLREPVVLHRGAILDGRARLRACEMAGVEPRFKSIENNPIAYAVSANLRRRHLSPSQRAMVASQLATLRQGANQHAQDCAPSQSEAARMMSVSRRSVQAARAILERDPEMGRRVVSGEMTVGGAAKAIEEAAAKAARDALRDHPSVQAAGDAAAAKLDELMERLAEQVDAMPIELQAAGWGRIRDALAQKTGLAGKRSRPTKPSPAIPAWRPKPTTMAERRRYLRGARDAEADERVRRELDPALIPLWQKLKRSFQGRNRLAEFLAYADAHPDEADEAMIASAETRTDALIREHERRST